MRVRLCALGLAVLLGAAPARAADAPALEAALHGWLAALLGPGVALSDRPVQLVPQDNHWAMTVPVTGGIGDGLLLLGAPVTATLRAMDGGRWALDAIRLPPDLRLSAATPQGESVWTLTLRDQDAHAVIDPALATTSSWDGRFGGYALHWQGPGGERQTEAVHVVSHLAWQPAAAGRIDVTATGRSELLTTNARMDRQGLVSFSAARTDAAGHIDALLPARVPALIQAALAAAPLLTPDASRHMSPGLRGALGAVLDVAGDLLAGFGEQVTMRDVHLHTRGMDLAMRMLAFGVNVSAPDGRIALKLHFAMDGLDGGAALPGGVGGDLVRHIALTPRLTGLPAGRVLALLHEALAHGGEDPALPAEAAALMRDNPLAVGVDDFSLELGPARFTAAGDMQVLGADQVSGQARLRATGIDALIRDARDQPALGQVMPLLVFLKGLGEPDGDATVWNIAYTGGHLTVNGTDLSQMVPQK